MTTKMEKAWVLTCDECPQATPERPIIIHVKKDKGEVEDFQKAHDKWHREKDQMTEHALLKSRRAREAIAKMRNPDTCQCFCPHHDSKTDCDEACRDVVLHMPSSLAGVEKALVVCHPCASAWQRRLEESDHVAVVATKGEQLHMYFYAEGEEHAVDGTEDSEGVPGSDGGIEGSSSRGSGDAEGDDVPPSAPAPSGGESTDL